jgi:hypothetical protein
MQVMERRIQKVLPGKFSEIQEWEKQWDVIEARMGGFPAKRRYWSYSGSLDLGIFVWEREWESMAALEAAYDKSQADPEARSLSAKADSIVKTGPAELYVPWSEPTE